MINGKRRYLHMHPLLKTWMIRLMKIFGMAAGGFVALALILGTFYAAEMKQLIVGELNKNLKSPVAVSDISFSLLRHFPYASVELHRVSAMDAPATGKPQPFLEAEKITLLFNILGMLEKDVSVKKVVMKNGSLLVRIDEQGNDNYHIWKASPDTSGSVIDLEKIILDRVNVRYDDHYAAQQYALNVHDATLK